MTDLETFALFLPPRKAPSTSDYQKTPLGVVRWTGDRFKSPPSREEVTASGFSMFKWWNENAVQRYSIHGSLVRYSREYEEAPFELCILYTGEITTPVDSGFD